MNRLLLNWGPIDADGTVNVRILYDHRVMDGANVARALERLEVCKREVGADEPDQQREQRDADGGEEQAILQQGHHVRLTRRAGG